MTCGHTITHSTRKCTTCSAWVSHYLGSVFGKDESIDTATAQRDTMIRGSLVNELDSLCTTTVSLRNALGTMHNDLARTHTKLEQSRNALNAAKANILHLNTHKVDLAVHARMSTNKMRKEIDSLKLQLCDLEQDSCRHKLPRRNSHPPSDLDSCYAPHQALHPDSPILEDQECDQEHAAPHPPRLLSRMAAQPEPAPYIQTPPCMDLALSSPFTGTDLASRLSGIAASVSAHPFTATAFYKSVGLYLLLPLLTYENRTLTPVHGSVNLNAQGSVDFIQKYCYIVATGMPGNWTTTLHIGSYFLEPVVQKALADKTLLPTLNIIPGGRGGVLIAPNHDPTSKEEVDALLSDPARHKRASKYVEHIRFTPPELRDEIHQCAFERWPDIQATRKRENQTQDMRRDKPPPDANNGMWIRWLKERRKQEKGAFTYIGIPHTCQGYKEIHIDGAKRVASFVPLTWKGAPNRGPLRDAIFRAAAALLSVPGQYTQVLDRLGQQISQNNQFQFYDIQQFGDENRIGINEIAQYLAFIGTTAEAAEHLQVWAAAYIDMELDANPDADHAPLLQEAKTQARERIDNNPEWVLRYIPNSCPGYYELGPMQPTHSRAMYNPRSTANQPEMSTTEAGLPSVTHPQTSQVDDEDTISLDCSWHEDERMGPAL